jgi:hypothetical protein
MITMTMRDPWTGAHWSIIEGAELLACRLYQMSRVTGMTMIVIARAAHQMVKNRRVQVRQDAIRLENRKRMSTEQLVAILERNYEEVLAEGEEAELREWHEMWARLRELARAELARRASA